MDLNDALKGVSGFLRGLRFSNGGTDVSDGFTYFSEEKLGGLTLSGKERDDYIQCLDGLAGSVSKRGMFSLRGVESLFQRAILMALDTQQGVEQVSEEGAKRAVKWLREAINSKPNTYLVYLPLVGLDPGRLPLQVGRLALLPGDTPTLEAMAFPVLTVITSSKNSDSEKAVLKTRMLEKINNSFFGKVVAALDVKAGDNDNAEEKAVRECRTAIDVFNFFADIFHSPGMRVCVSLLGEGHQVTRLNRESEKVRLTLMLREKGGHDESSFPFQGRQVSGYGTRGQPMSPMSALELPKPDTAYSVETGFARVCGLLGKDPRTPLEDRLLAAFQWAGRATVHPRREEAFLLYMIALESLVAGKIKAENTWHVTSRTAHLIKDNLDDRKSLSDRLKVMYNVRSRIVHDGSHEVADLELREIRRYGKLAVLTVANGEPFRNMKTEEELNDWFEARVLS